ncbi:OsmC family protein [Phenylobacterium sp.]|jgi:putative redox protein|uniref:OsmC family protein n=1 Tax=Phenylobacterium sp. TaxID=1871053 RepID=UPI002E319552|nr:OsmC family protein [Phenylobacterium sp.]HEX4712155.1 OsmC family protein [Phenylobacterium sp.]
MADQARRSTADDPGLGGLQLLVGAGPARFVADEPVEAGGLDLGPTPHELVSAGLAACATQTMRLYARRKGWPLGAVHVEVAHAKDATATPPDQFIVTVRLDGPLSMEQQARLMEIADNCPVHRLLVGGAQITTAQGPLPDEALARSVP